MTKHSILFSLIVSALAIGVTRGAVERRNALRGAGALAAKDQPSQVPTNSQPVPASTQTTITEAAEVDDFLDLFRGRPASRLRALGNIESRWHPGNTVMLVECLRLLRHQGTGKAVQNLLQKKTGYTRAKDLNDWFRWVWQQSYERHPRYATFKAKLYSRIDPRFRDYFNDSYAAKIRLDEIRWGGVRRDGIPPLKNPRLISADKATYLDKANVVFGLENNGDARAYPKRILAWHEMVKETLGDTSINGAYCTLCGSMIVYSTRVDGVHYELGTSGFLYRSNKLMYDKKTKSLWSTLTGEPVVGPLVDKQIKLKRIGVVTTTWGRWRRQHPDTKVLSLATGHRRNYDEGVAYRNYFSNDNLMFSVPLRDTRLKNKAEVLALRVADPSDERLAISADFLLKNPLYHDSIGTVSFVVLTDPSGANRVYETGARRFTSWNPDANSVDEEDRTWKISEAELTSPTGDSLTRLPAHRAFWFGWHAAYPKTRLVR